MKNTMKVLALALALVISSKSHAVTSQLNSPAWGQGKPVANSISKMGIQPYMEAGLSDCTTGVSYPAVLSNTSSVINVTSTAGLSPSSTTSPYTAGFKVNVSNVGPTTVVAWVSMSSTTIALTSTAGTVILAGQGGSLFAASRDGITLHMSGLTATALTTVNVCNY